MSLEKMGQAAREAAYQLATVSTAQKNRALAAIADELEARSHQILAANEKDIAAGRAAG
ncbi:TPA: gamma-glutamyl-phosphate reductase, partial [Aeromonas hydrophila]|nr:gamma-glutamyl-phosphate reductase [Aeromonas hydrophila]